MNNGILLQETLDAYKQAVAFTEFSGENGKYKGKIIICGSKTLYETDYVFPTKEMAKEFANSFCNQVVLFSNTMEKLIHKLPGENDYMPRMAAGSGSAIVG